MPRAQRHRDPSRACDTYDAIDDGTRLGKGASAAAPQKPGREPDASKGPGALPAHRSVDSLLMSCTASPVRRKPSLPHALRVEAAPGSSRCVRTNYSTPASVPPSLVVPLSAVLITSIGDDLLQRGQSSRRRFETRHPSWTVGKSPRPRGSQDAAYLPRVAGRGWPVPSRRDLDK
ncbi:hypothetical protein TRAPUB_9871 [Trametes pubescens]|uniref:Uncharacterized protein n=1 Tax=Trametes pubescens TaxID=154538 RepID=A0A1M2W148_TRAPU|nr:hypothetical protein TRAPUB_6516 [Trametes pubescens]OJT13581.1 hypothetical protein TRAPUB_9871 [Trametes pubescens]